MTTKHTHQQNDTSNQLQNTLIHVIEQLVDELHAKRVYAHSVSLDSSLDRDLGLDSLARMELLTRLEKQFDIQLSEQLLATAETPRDLLRKLHTSDSNITSTQTTNVKPTDLSERGIEIPHQATTLVDALLFHTSIHKDQVHLLLENPTEENEELSYQDLLDGARQLGAGLQASGLQPGNSVAIMLPTGVDYFFSFLGILLAGGVPVPLYPPVRPSQIEEHLRRHRKILSNCMAKILITLPEVKPVARLLRAQVENLNHIVSVKEILKDNATFFDVPIQSDDIAFLQYTSGSTGDPKGVVLTHANLLANIQAMGQVTKVTSGDVFVSWLPLYHDMGLIGAWLGSLFHGAKLVIMSPLSFLARPERWLWAIHNHGGTLSASPNFGYELCCNRLDDRSLEGLDLSSWRLAFNGAEPVSPDTLINFEKRFRPYGFNECSSAPVYGLAESSVGLAFPPLGRSPLIDHIQRDIFVKSGTAVPENTDLKSLRFVACGRPLPGHQIRIVDKNNRELPERQEGRLQFKGPSTTNGYFRNPDQTRALFHGNWLDSGDLAYMADGDIFITSRIKDVIIRGGRNIYPHEVEDAVGNINGVRNGGVVVFGSHDKRSATERIIILAETRARKEETINQLKKKIADISIDLVGMVADKIVLAPPGTVLKTSSGKIRRAACKDLYEHNLIGKPKRAVWLQITRLALRGIIPQLRRLQRRCGENIYALYCWLLFGLIVIPLTFFVALFPLKTGRSWLTRQGGRLLFMLTGTKIVVDGLHHLNNKSTFILASNHMSYLDSLVLFTALPLQCSFVGKAELANNPIMKLLLSNLNVVFVNRFDFSKGIEDTKLLAHQVDTGKHLLFFCEGTFQRMPGLLPFQLGAFVIATQKQTPVVPITIRGTRNKLRADTWFPRMGGLRITISKPLAPDNNSWKAAVDLRDRVRAEILCHSGELDLSGEYTSITQMEIFPKDKQ